MALRVCVYVCVCIIFVAKTTQPNGWTRANGLPNSNDSVLLDHFPANFPVNFLRFDLVNLG